MAVNH